MNGDDGPTVDDVDSMIRELEPSWRVREATPTAEGTDAVFFATVETRAGTRECVVKACDFVDPEEFRPEPYVLEVLNAHTSVPVPTVYGRVDRHDDLPAPYFCMERCEGEVREGDARALPPAVVERIARDGGRHLGEVHGLGSFDRFGPVRLADAPADARDSPDPDRLRVADAGHETWRARLEELVDRSLENVHDRFADLESPLRRFVRARLDAVDPAVVPVLGNADYRLGNLLVDTETGETLAAIDWGNLSTTDPAFDLVALEENLSGRGPLDDPLRRRVRGAIRDGYAETAPSRCLGGYPPTRDGAPTRRGELYYATARLAPLVWFSLWYGGATDGERSEAAETHRGVVRDLVEDGSAP